MSVHFMSQSVDWSTPKGVYDRLNGEFYLAAHLFNSRSALIVEHVWAPPTRRTEK